MNQMEVKGAIAGDGSLILPPGVLETMGAGPGDPVYLAYGSRKPVRAENSYGRLFLSAEGFWKGNSSFLYGGYGHAGIRIGLKLLGNRQDSLRIRVHWQVPR